MLHKNVPTAPDKPMEDNEYNGQWEGIIFARIFYLKRLIRGTWFYGNVLMKISHQSSAR